MKKTLAFILALCLCLGLIACSENGSTKTDKKINGVPDQYLKMDIEDYIYEEKIDTEYTFTATHNYDKSSAVDSVAITLDFKYEFGKESFVGTCNYRYDSAANNWSRIGDVRWSDAAEELSEQAYEKKHSGTTLGLQWNVDIRDLDLQNGTITCDIELINSSGAVYRTDGFYTYQFERGSFDIDVLGTTYTVYLGVHGIDVLKNW